MPQSPSCSSAKYSMTYTPSFSLCRRLLFCADTMHAGRKYRGIKPTGCRQPVYISATSVCGSFSYAFPPAMDAEGKSIEQELEGLGSWESALGVIVPCERGAREKIRPPQPGSYTLDFLFWFRHAGRYWTPHVVCRLSLQDGPPNPKATCSIPR